MATITSACMGPVYMKGTVREGQKEVALLPFKTVNSKIQISRGYLQPTAEGRNGTNPAQRFTLTLVITEGENSYQIVEI